MKWPFATRKKDKGIGKTDNRERNIWPLSFTPDLVTLAVGPRNPDRIDCTVELGPGDRLTWGSLHGPKNFEFYEGIKINFIGRTVGGSLQAAARRDGLQPGVSGPYVFHSGGGCFWPLDPEDPSSDILIVSEISRFSRQAAVLCQEYGIDLDRSHGMTSYGEQINLYGPYADYVKFVAGETMSPIARAWLRENGVAGWTTEIWEGGMSQVPYRTTAIDLTSKSRVAL